MKYILLLILFPVIISCSNQKNGNQNKQDRDTITGKDTLPPDDNGSGAELPGWLNIMIRKWEQNPGPDDPESVHQYIYNGAKVYYFTMPCCDRFNELYDKNGDRICSPDGGITGQGDGKCLDFHVEKKDEHMIWIRK